MAIPATFVLGKRGYNGMFMTWAAPAITGSYNASLGERIPFDPSSGNVVINAPSSPGEGDYFGVKNITADTTNITVSGSGKSLEHPIEAFNLTSSVSFGGDAISIVWEYTGSEWVII